MEYESTRIAVILVEQPDELPSGGLTMNGIYVLFATPLVSLCAVGALQVWNEMSGSQPELPIGDMARPTAKVEFGLFEPMMARPVAEEPLGLRAAIQRPLTVPEDSQIGSVVVVGKFSVLGPLTQSAAAKSEPRPSVIGPLSQPLSLRAPTPRVGIPEWISDDRRDPRADA